MEIVQLRQEINDLLDNLVKHSNTYTAQKHLSPLDANFMLKKIGKVQERIVVLKHLLELEHQKKEENKLVNIIPETVEDVVEDRPEEKPIILDEPVVEDVKEEVIIESNPIEEIVVSEIKEEVVAEVEVQHQEAPVSLGMEEPPIAKLADGLTLNDRYLYANELFNKDMNGFNEMVKSIDTCNSFDEAVAIYSSMDWELENEHVLSFTNLVERRFS